MIHAVNNYALPKNRIVHDFPLRLTKCWLEKHLLLFRTIAFYCVGLIFQQKQRQNILTQWKYAAIFLQDLASLVASFKYV